MAIANIAFGVIDLGRFLSRTERAQIADPAGSAKSPKNFSAILVLLFSSSLLVRIYLYRTNPPGKPAGLSCWFFNPLKSLFFKNRGHIRPSF